MVPSKSSNTPLFPVLSYSSLWPIKVLIYIYFKIKNHPKSIGASFSKISLIELEIFKVKEWFQVKVPIPFSFQSSLIAVYERNITQTSAKNISSHFPRDYYKRGPETKGCWNFYLEPFFDL